MATTAVHHQPSTDLVEHPPLWHTAVPVIVATVALLGLAAGVAWALRGLLALGLWFLGAQ
ncbi:MAG: hypothetical protein KQH57_02530 [Actinomycetales bacterium]|nr:hypothetical protein [Actinomycetales bacterium]